MADIKKYQSGAVGRLLLHNNRTADDGVIHSNREIDEARTHLNYNLKKGSAEDIKKRLKSVYHMNRKNIIVLAEAIVTLPKDVKPEDEETFFKAVYDFYKEDFGEDNIINAAVHKDERSPHIHLDFIPVLGLENEMSEVQKKRIERYGAKTGEKIVGSLNAYRLLNRFYFQKMHPRLSDFVEERLGYKCEILNGATVNGSRSIDELKLRDLEEKIRRKEERLNILNKNITILNADIKNLGIDEKYYDSFSLIHANASLQNEIDVLKDIIKAEGIEIPKSKIESVVLERAQFNDKHSNFTFISGVKNNIGPNDIQVIECFSKRERILPARDFIEKNPEIEHLIKEGLTIPTLLEHQEKKILLFPTDDIKETFGNLLFLGKKKELENKKIIFPVISNDSFNIAETILRQCAFETEYVLKKKKDRHELILQIMNAEKIKKME